MEGIAIYFQDFASVSPQYYKLRRSCVVAGSLARTTATATITAKKTIGLDKQNNYFERVTGFFVHFSVALHDYDVKLPNFTFCRGREQKATTFFFFS